MSKVKPRTKQWGRRFGGVALLFFLAMTSLTVHADECRVFDEMLALTSHAPAATDSDIDWNKWTQSRYQSAVASANEIFSEYVESRWATGEAARCLKNPQDLENFAFALPNVFTDQTLARLKSMNIPGMKLLTDELTARMTGSEILPFRLTGHLPSEVSPNDKMAGFHRGHQSIFMSFEKIPSSQWFIIFIHETLHALDADLQAGVQAFANKDARIRLSKALSGEVPLTSRDRSWLDPWLMGGLNRSYLAEARAWAATLHFYVALKALGIQAEIPTLEEMLRERKVANESSESYFSLTLRYLDSRFTDPETEGFFTLLEVRSALGRIRDEIRTGRRQVELGSLSRFMQD